MNKLIVLVAGGVGYLLGSRAGRAPYERVRRQAEHLTSNPWVHQRVDQAKRIGSHKPGQATTSAAGDPEDESAEASGVPVTASDVESSAGPTDDRS